MKTPAESALKRQKQARRLELKGQLEGAERISPEKRAALFKELAQTEKALALYKKRERAEEGLKEARLLLKTEKDPAMVCLAKEEIEALSAEKALLGERIRSMDFSPDPLDDKNVIMEIRAGAGGLEAGLFAAELAALYQAFAVKQKWSAAPASLSPARGGGFREAVLEIKGQGAYGRLKFESGVHRVQRVPQTEAQGRVHTSTVTVVALPEADPQELKIPPQDIRIDVQKSGGPGGQHVNTTDSAVRAIHIPTKITVYCQQEKSQRANRERALKILYARVWDYERQKREKARSETRKTLMGGGARAQKIRTYNFPQSRLTDHRLPLTLKTLPLIMKGEIEPLIQALEKAEREAGGAKKPL